MDLTIIYLLVTSALVVVLTVCRNAKKQKAVPQLPTHQLKRIRASYIGVGHIRTETAEQDTHAMLVQVYSLYFVQL